MKPSTEYKTSGGITIHKMPVQAFPGWYVNSYLILDDQPSLIDPGTAFSIAELEAQLKNVGFELADLKRIIITHVHYDHFMLAGYVKEKSGAAIYAHESTVDNIRYPVEKHDEYHVLFDRVAVREGMSPEFLKAKIEQEKPREDQFIQMLKELDFELDRPVTDKIGDWEVIHTPGHSPGHICVLVDDFIFLGDHILSSTTPHQTPTDFGDGHGLQNYLDSLAKIKERTEAKKFHGLAGHEDDVPEVAARAAAIERFHQTRLDHILGLCGTEKNAWEIMQQYYQSVNEREGNHVNIKGQEGMALTEILAHIEYLCSRGKLQKTERDGVVYYQD